MNINILLAYMFTVLVYLIECRSYYEILGVKKDESIGGIKKAFRNLALKYHPDKVKNPDKKTEENFREIVAAYEVLSDPEKRKAYDMTGNTNFNGHQQHHGHGGGDNFNFDDFFKNFDEAFRAHQEQHLREHHRAHREALKRNHGFQFDFDDLFDDNFGGFDSIGGMFDGADGGLHEFGNSYFSEVHENSGGRNCKTIEKREGNTFISKTVCT